MICSKLKDKPKLPSTSKVESSLAALWSHQVTDQSGPLYLKWSETFHSLEISTAPPQQGKSRCYSQQWLGVVVCKICVPSWQETMKLQNSEDLLLVTKGKPWSYTMDRKLNSYCQIICCFFLFSFFLDLEKMLNFSLPQWTAFCPLWGMKQHKDTGMDNLTHLI